MAIRGSGRNRAVDSIGSLDYPVTKLVTGEVGTDGGVISETSPLPVNDKGIGPTPMILSRYLDTNGDGTGTKDAKGDYNASLQEFYIQPASGEIYRIERMIVHYDDAGTMDTDVYGNGITLTSGIFVQIRNESELIVDLTDNVPITSNGDWGRVCYDLQHYTFGAGDEMISIRWPFNEYGTNIRLDGDANEKLTVLLHDNFSGLTEHRFMAQGYLENTLT